MPDHNDSSLVDTEIVDRPPDAYLPARCTPKARKIPKIEKKGEPRFKVAKVKNKKHLDALERRIQSIESRGICSRADLRFLEYIKKHESEPSVDHTIFTDGSYIEWTDAQGKIGVAGIGVYFGPGDPRNLSECVDLDRRDSSSFRAEVHALIRALELCRDRKGSLRIETDSFSAMQAVSPDSFKLSRAHSDLYTKLRDLLMERTDDVYLRNVPGHTGIPGNTIADMLAGRASHERAEYMKSKGQFW
ncbi:ribonuclease H-like domain-containing protein [Phycomyces nitens]|nr:ribonuclease H-like domain-containing protein [Phycomyces nitens]